MKLNLELPEEYMKWYVTTVIKTEDVLLVDPIASSKVIAIYDSVYN